MFASRREHARGADRLAHEPDELQLLGRRQDAHLALEGRRPVVVDHRRAVRSDLRRGLFESGSWREVLGERHLRPHGFTEQRMERQARLSGGNVPERDLDSRGGARRHHGCARGPGA